MKRAGRAGQDMGHSGEQQAGGLFAGRPAAVQWAALVVGSVLVAVALTYAGLPAALMLGPMIAGIAIGTNGGSIKVPRLPAVAAQTIVGCLVARAITADIVLAFLKDWPLLLGVVLAMVAASVLLGLALSRFKSLPGTTAVWGTAPGGASAMMIMAGAFGADPRLVAFMQYLRVVFVAALASLVAWLWVGAGAAAAAHDPGWFAAFRWQDFAVTLAIAAIGGSLGALLRIPAGSLLVPMVIGSILEVAGLVSIVLPPWLLAITYAVLGSSVGLGFTRDILAHVSRALPLALLAVFVMIAVSAGLAVVLVKAAGVDPLTAYLATSPGGVDTVAIIAASSNVNLSFVMALQTLRVVIVLAIGPPLARYIARRMS